MSTVGTRAHWEWLPLPPNAPNTGPDFATGSLYVGFGTGFSGPQPFDFRVGYIIISERREVNARAQLNGEKVLFRGDLEYLRLETIRFWCLE